MPELSEDGKVLATSLIGLVTHVGVFELGSIHPTRFSSPDAGASGKMPISRTNASVS